MSRSKVYYYKEKLINETKVKDENRSCSKKSGLRAVIISWYYFGRAIFVPKHDSESSLEPNALRFIVHTFIILNELVSM